MSPVSDSSSQLKIHAYNLGHGLLPGKSAWCNPIHEPVFSRVILRRSGGKKSQRTPLVLRYMVNLTIIQRISVMLV